MIEDLPNDNYLHIYQAQKLTRITHRHGYQQLAVGASVDIIEIARTDSQGH